MPEFLHLQTPDEARSLLLRSLPEPQPAAENIDTTQALGRVTALPVEAPHPLPSFNRSAMDGYALHATDTFGASESLPAYLKVIGEVSMGAQPDIDLHPGEAVLIHTGGMLPASADAVIMLEYTQMVGRGDLHGRPGPGAGTPFVPPWPDRQDRRTPAARRCETASPAPTTTEIEISRAVAEGENVLRIGEDVRQGQVVIPAGMRIRPAEIGGLMALGMTQVAVAKRPRVGLISSGDEVVQPEQTPRPGQVRDVNSYTLSALVTRIGGEPVLYGILPDDLETMKQVARRALSECDLVIITAGSSASARDITADAISFLGKPGVLVHGVNIRPGKPTILAVCDGKAVIGLPGNPVSALVIAGLFVVPVIERLLGLPLDRPRPSLFAKLTINVPSQAGREDWVAVKLLPPSPSRRGAGGEVLAEPIFSKSNLIFSLVAADGIVRISPDATGLSAGEIVEVVLF
jgi:molybdopterin molybdotransferase